MSATFPKNPINCAIFGIILSLIVLAWAQSTWAGNRAGTGNQGAIPITLHGYATSVCNISMATTPLGLDALTDDASNAIFAAHAAKTSFTIPFWVMCNAPTVYTMSPGIGSIRYTNQSGATGFGAEIPYSVQLISPHASEFDQSRCLQNNFGFGIDHCEQYQNAIIGPVSGRGYLRIVIDGTAHDGQLFATSEPIVLTLDARP